MRFSALLLTLTLGFNTSGVMAADLWTGIFKEKLPQAEQGSADAQFEIGAMYENGRGVKIDRIAARDWYRKASAQGHSRATSALARIEDNERRFSKTQQQAESGDHEAEYTLGTMYLTGTGTDVDLTQAQFWLKRAANKGHVKAQYKLGHLYYIELGDRADNQAAHEWFSKAASAQYAPALYYLGDMHAAGAGVTQDYSQARTWYQKAIDAGFTPAKKALKELDERIADDKARKLAQAEAARKAAEEQAAQAAAQAAAARQAPVARAAPAPKPVLHPRERLLQGTWHDGNAHAQFLPSQVSQCTPGADDIVCYSKELARKDLPQERYRVKSIIRDFTAKGEFKIVYRELVLQTADSEARQDDQAAKTGWLEPHTLTCKFGDDEELTCVIDGGTVATFKGV